MVSSVRTAPWQFILTYAATDNTNADPETRAVWIALGQKHQVPIRCVHFTTPAKLCEHNDTVRALSDSTFNPEKRTILPHSAFASFAARYKEPKIDEGFQDIIQIAFQVRKPRVYKQYLILRFEETNNKLFAITLVHGERGATKNLE